MVVVHTIVLAIDKVLIAIFLSINPIPKFDTKLYATFAALAILLARVFNFVAIVDLEVATVSELVKTIFAVFEVLERLVAAVSAFLLKILPIEASLDSFCAAVWKPMVTNH